MYSAFVYIMTNTNNTTLYIGVTTYLHARVHEHKACRDPKSFTARYKLFKVVYFKGFPTLIEAIAFEKFLKRKVRKYKMELINKFNPEWMDLESKTPNL
jgi:putative endonuclease